MVAVGLLQRVAERFQLNCVMLTVFKSNARALAFYMDKLGYAVDDEDPLRSTIPTSATTFCRGGAAASTPRRLRRGERAQGDDPAASCICAALSRRHPKHPT